MKMKPIWFALILGGFAFISLTLFVYAFMQQAEAKRQKSVALEFEQSAVECEKYSHEIKFKFNSEVDSLKDTINSLGQKIRLLEEQAAKSKNKK
ncbi:MAG TPA: hypothetical protein DHV26_02255 [Cytophagales bacterium]|nr:hypothetical protein [Cytophagales bacterium]HRG09151.1 hypothetical protein [Cyclobacteriaceae bacterium]